MERTDSARGGGLTTALHRPALEVPRRQTPAGQHRLDVGQHKHSVTDARVHHSVAGACSMTVGAMMAKVEVTGR